MSELAFSIVRGNDADTIAALYRIYVASIDATERKSREQIEAMLLRPSYRCVVARRGSEVVGFAIVFVSAAIDSFALLEYIAVKATARGAGIGTSLFRESLKLALEGRDLSVLLEVDAPDSRSDGDTRRRERFYRQQLGCLKVDGLPYHLPLRANGHPPRMELLIYFPSRPRVLNKPELRRWLGAMYRDVYGAPGDDPRINDMLRGVADPVRLV